MMSSLYLFASLPDQADLVKLGSLHTVESDVAPLNTGLFIEHKIDRHGGRSWKRQYPLDKPHDDDKKHLKNVGPIRHCEPPHADVHNNNDNA